MKRWMFTCGMFLFVAGTLCMGENAKAKTVNGTTPEGLKYTYESTSKIAEVTGYQGTVADVVVPEKIDGKSIEAVQIANNTSIKTLSLPASVTVINAGVKTETGDLGNLFSGCPNLESYTVAEANKVYKSVGGMLYSKKGTDLLSVPQGKTGTTTVESNVTVVKPEAFLGCQKITDIQVAAGNKKYVSADGILFNMKKDTIIAYPAGCTADTYTVPAGVKKIGQGAFAYNVNLTSLTTTNVKEINYFGVGCCEKLKNVNLAKGISILYGYAFAGNKALESINLPEGLGEIEHYALYGCSGLKNIVLPKTVFKINVNGLPYSTIDSLTAPTVAVLCVGKISFKAGMNLTANTANPLYKIWKKQGNGGTFTSIKSKGYISFKKAKQIKTKSSVKKGKGKATTKWYKKKKKVFYISTPDQLAGIDVLLRKGVTFSGKRIVLKKNLDLKKYKNWRPIGFQDNKFKKDFGGVFDGNGKTIYNMTCIYPQSDTIGLFALLSETGKVMNVNLKGASVMGRLYVAGIVASTNAMIQNCTFRGNVSGMNRVSGICGFTERMDNARTVSCVNYGTIRGVANVGGLIGYCNTDSSAAMKKSKNKGKIYGYYHVGAKAGFIE